jgi:hypothetical protein
MKHHVKNPAVIKLAGYQKTTGQSPENMRSVARN